MHARRQALGGSIPRRRSTFEPIAAPDLNAFSGQLKGSGERAISSTMAFVRVLSTLTKDKVLGERVVPIVPDEARTFGMEGMFRQLGIYSSQGQLYTPHDAGGIMYYKEDAKGQILEEGINESGAMSAWLASATSYSAHNAPLIPFYIFYSMFGFQRIGDLAWAAGDSQARGFLIGATSGRTTLNGEGLQHQDGHSHLVASTIPNCVSYDPTYGYELAVIVQDGMKRMYELEENRFYYITTMNENYAHPEMPLGVEEGILKGLYQLSHSKSKAKKRVQLMGSGAILQEVRAAADLLLDEWGVAADVWSLTSSNELRRDGMACERWNMLNPTEKPRVPYLTQVLQKSGGPFIAATDYMKVYADQLRPYIPGTYKVLGTDGFGRSDTRAKLRYFFEVNRYFVTVAALTALVEEGAVKAEVVSEALVKYGLSGDKPDPVTI